MKLTGSLWWAIGFHGALDWAEDFFYGVANSGNVRAAGHLFASHPIGVSSLQRRRADGPERAALFAVGAYPCSPNVVAVAGVLLIRRSAKRTA